MDDGQVAALNQLLRTFIERHEAQAPVGAAVSMHARRIAEFAQQTPTPWRSARVPSEPHRAPHIAGHITASAWVLNAARTHAALVHHRKLERWLQPGGHVEESDSSWLAASRREVMEETGLTALTLSPQYGAELFDVDVHDIPERVATPTRHAEPAHTHFDLRFLWIAGSAQSLALNCDESLGVQWFELSALAADDALDESVRRMARYRV
ncbi:MAG: NUDIX domain-containing protein [Betaproteobacteria bacterium]|nr:MAG: NUDIX domain-containing protein [Betaproteobacteria bacterium]